jgi:hypothetical protein
MVIGEGWLADMVHQVIRENDAHQNSARRDEIFPFGGDDNDRATFPRTIRNIDVLPNECGGSQNQILDKLKFGGHQIRE